MTVANYEVMAYRKTQARDHLRAKIAVVYVYLNFDPRTTATANHIQT